ncbi:MAG: cob(I)yrinic acid a,c-diamide adenosyltransferase [Bdellovibrionales bacterium]|nr:cob(I)yrinic acid a,c-diamide adenosyltransferase [Bdellovibrionales bacterium]
MKIYTKSGDQGETSLVDGSRVKKNHPRVEAYGTVDELNSILGICLSLAHKDKKLFQDQRLNGIPSIQNDLFNLGSQLACPKEEWRVKMPSVGDNRLQFLETEIDEMTEALEPLKEFILPGGHLVSSFLHQARCLCRRAERRVFELGLEDMQPIKYLNRLSDHLFVLARYVNLQTGVSEVKWKK